MGVLGALANAIQRRPTSRVWKDCLSIFVDAVAADDADYLLELDKRYAAWTP